MLYEITTDCRIANKEYKKGDIVTIDEVWQYFTTVMKPLRDTPIKEGSNKPTEVKKDAEEVIEEPKETEEPKKAEKVEEVKQEPKKASKKKK